MAIDQAKVNQYRQWIQALLLERSKNTAHRRTEKQVIFDSERDHYQIVNVGWSASGRRNYGCILHLDIKDGKIWIQHDGTEEGIANALVALGVPKEDIILAFHAPEMREYTEFALGI
jgi:hypothetical protein